MNSKTFISFWIMTSLTLFHGNIQAQNNHHQNEYESELVQQQQTQRQYHHPWLEDERQNVNQKISSRLLENLMKLKYRDFMEHSNSETTPNFHIRERKRALTMLTRWKPFRMTTYNGGNGRHVIRSPFAPMLPDGHHRLIANRMRPIGQPLRWG